MFSNIYFKLKPTPGLKFLVVLDVVKCLFKGTQTSILSSFKLNLMSKELYHQRGSQLAKTLTHEKALFAINNGYFT